MAKKKTSRKPKPKAADIKLDERNANKHNERSVKAVSESIAKLGAGRSIVVDADNTIIGGENTFRRAQELGLPVQVIDSDGSKLVVVRRIDLKSDDPRRRALALADNKTGQLSGLDFSEVAEQLKQIEADLDELDLDGFDLTVTGFEQFELETIMKEKSDPEPTPEPDEPASAAADDSTAHQQSDGRSIFFGQDQFEIVDKFIKLAKEHQGDEASEAEVIVWGLLQLIDRLEIESQK